MRFTAVWTVVFPIVAAGLVGPAGAEGTFLFGGRNSPLKQKAEPPPPPEASGPFLLFGRRDSAGRQWAEPPTPEGGGSFMFGGTAGAPVKSAPVVDATPQNVRPVEAPGAGATTVPDTIADGPRP